MPTNMKGMFRTGLILLAAAAAACAPRERTLVLLSTNDMHAKIQNFPRLAAAVENCRDTALLVVLVAIGVEYLIGVAPNGTLG